jgi:hypothetical protein
LKQNYFLTPPTLTSGKRHDPSERVDGAIQSAPSKSWSHAQ